MIRLLDDIEQHLIDGQRQRAVVALVQRRGITYEEAKVEIARRLLEKGEPLRRPRGSLG